jgi:hypothetical protein
MCVPKRPYSLDLVPSDFGLFGDLKRSFAGQKFECTNDIYDAVLEFLESAALKNSSTLLTRGSKE